MSDREELLRRLPEDLRQALAREDYAGFRQALRNLSPEQHVVVRDVMRKLAACPTGVEEGGTPEAGVAPQDDLVEDAVNNPLEVLEQSRGLPTELYRSTPEEAVPAVFPDEATLNEATRAVPLERPVLMPVWFATNRKPTDPNVPEAGFSKQREEPGELHHGVAVVNIPRYHHFGSIGSSFWWRVVTWTDDRVMLQAIRPRSPEEFWRGAGQQLGVAQDSSQVLLYVHGYNVTFAGAVVRAAQIGCDLQFPGLTSCFSWTSKGTYRGYPADTASVQLCVPALADFIERWLERVGSGRVHLLAHSMGNRAALAAVDRLVESGKLARVKLGHVILAAPDVDAGVFQTLGGVYAQAVDSRQGRRVTLYASDRDRALRSSRWLYGFARAGYIPPVTCLEGIDTINVGNVDLTWVGHGYYGSAAPVLEDVGKLLFDDRPPGPGRRVRQHLEAGCQSYWVLS